ncbi:MAG TPA: IPT/TIG domain-containing protein [Vicinamibacteria bacterium]|jgi:hypothetical protein
MSDAPPAAPPPVERRRFPRRWRRARRALVGLLVLIALGVLGNLAFRRLGGPRIDALVPEQARIGEAVTLEGRGFGRALEDNVVLFSDMPGRTLSAATDELVVEVPDLELPPEGRLTVSVKVQLEENESNRASLVVLPALQPEPATGPQDAELEEPEPAPSPAAPPSPPASPR